jgi:hypothetical protein
MSIVDTGRFWEILVIPVLQILEDSRDHTKYFDITGLLPLMLCTAEMTYEYELYSILLL